MNTFVSKLVWRNYLSDCLGSFVLGVQCIRMEYFHFSIFCTMPVKYHVRSFILTANNAFHSVLANIGYLLISLVVR